MVCRVLNITRAIACDTFLSHMNYGNLRKFCGHYTYTTRTVSNLLPTFLRDLPLRAYNFQAWGKTSNFGALVEAQDYLLPPPSITHKAVENWGGFR